MKIRAKLLLALTAISLFPPIAAYVTLNDNPRRTCLRSRVFPVRWNLTDRQIEQEPSRKLSSGLDFMTNSASFTQPSCHRADAGAKLSQGIRRSELTSSHAISPSGLAITTT